MKNVFSQKSASLLVRATRCFLIGLSTASLLATVASPSFAQSAAIPKIFTSSQSKLLVPTLSTLSCKAGINGNPKIPNAAPGKKHNIGAFEVPTYDFSPVQHLSSSCRYGIVWVQDKNNKCKITSKSQIGIVDLGIISNINGKQAVIKDNYQLGDGSNGKYVTGTDFKGSFYVGSASSLTDVSMELFDLPDIPKSHSGTLTAAPIYYSCS